MVSARFWPKIPDCAPPITLWRTGFAPSQKQLLKKNNASLNTSGDKSKERNSEQLRLNGSGEKQNKPVKTPQKSTPPPPRKPPGNCHLVEPDDWSHQKRDPPGPAPAVTLTKLRPIKVSQTASYSVPAPCDNVHRPRDFSTSGDLILPPPLTHIANQPIRAKVTQPPNSPTNEHAAPDLDAHSTPTVNPRERPLESGASPAKKARTSPGYRNR